MENTEYKVGDILVNHWGYSMILVTFYEVMKVTAKSLVVQERRKITSSIDSSGCGNIYVVPQAGFYSQESKRILKKNAWRKWDGQPQMENHYD